MTISMDFDDYSPLNNGLLHLVQLRERDPDMKVTLFTTPWEIRWTDDGLGTPITDIKYQPWVEATKRAIKEGWMEIALHGLTHAPSEFGALSYDASKKRIIVAKKMFKNVGIDICDLFKAPFWQTSKEAKKAVKDEGLRLVEDGYYNFNLKDEFPEKEKRIVAHGHIQNDPNAPNGLEESFTRICKIPSKAKWEFLSKTI